MTTVTPIANLHIVKCNSMPAQTLVATARRAAELEKSLRRVIRGKDDVLRLALVPFSPRVIY